jgi:hypothetical protein
VLISVAEFAARKGVSPQAVRKAIKTGRLERSAQLEKTKPKGSTGRPGWVIDPEIAELEWERNTEPGLVRTAAQINAGKARARGEDVEPPAPVAPIGPPGSRAGAGTFASAKAASEGYKAMLLKLDYEERSGKLLEKAAAERAFAAAGMQVRDAVLRTSQQMVGEIATAVGGLSQEQRAAVMQVIDRHHVRALEELVRAAGVA